MPWEKLEIEPALLSLVCEGLNEKRKARGQATIDAALLKETGEAIIGDFYQRCVADVPDKTRRFIEDALITEGGFRNSYPLQDALEQGALTEPLLRQLVDRRLLRIDHQLGADRVELIHDRLTDVVREHRDRERERIRARSSKGECGGRRVRSLSFSSAIGAVFFFLWLSAQRAAEADTRRLGGGRTGSRLMPTSPNGKLRLRKTGQTRKQARRRGKGRLRRPPRSNQSPGGDNSSQGTGGARRRAASAPPMRQGRRCATAVAGKLVMQSRAILEGHRAATTDVALLLAAAGYRLKPDNEAYGGLQYALKATPGLAKVVSFPDPVLAVSPDGRTAVTTRDGTTLRLWDAATGQPRGAPLQGHTDVVASVAFSPDGKTLVSGSDDNTLRLWDAATGQPRGAPLQGHTSAVGSVAFSPDGKTLVSGSDDKTAAAVGRRHRPARGAPLQGHTDWVESVAFSPDGKTLVSGSADDDAAAVGRRHRPAARRAPARAHGRS